MKALVIESSADLRQPLINAFRAVGLESPVFATTLPQALRLLDGSFDFIVTDGNASHARALGLTRQLRGTESTAQLPIILLTSQRGESAELAGAVAGANRTLVKPLTAAQLADTLTDLVEPAH